MSESSQKLGLIASVALHVGAGAIIVFGLPNWQAKRPTPPAPVAIEFVRIAEKTQVRAAAPETEEEPAPQADNTPQVARSEAREEAVADAVPLPSRAAPETIPTPKPKPKINPQEKARRALVARAAPRRKPKAPSRLKSKVISSLIDKSIKEEKQPVRRAEEKREPTAETKKADPFSGLRGRFATASLVDALSQKLRGCWRFPIGAKNIEDMQVTVRIHLRADGELSREPQYVSPGDLSDGFYRVFAESALRAVRNCTPFDEAKTLFSNGQNYIDFTFYGAEFSGG